MNALNGATTALFNFILTPLEAVGREFALIMVSGIFGVLALLVFKHISSQKSIKAAKDKIKGHMIEIRLYQDDLALVSKAIGKVLWHNLRYVCLNFGPFIPLSIPFALVAAQMVVRYGFEPVDVQNQPGALLAGEGVTVKVDMAEGSERQAGDIEIILPDGVEAVSPLARIPSQGIAAQEVVATKSGTFELTIKSGSDSYVKTLHAGDDEPRYLQPERTASLFMALLWPAEDTLSGSVDRIYFSSSPNLTAYPEAPLGWLPGSGPVAVLLWFVGFSMLFGFAALKPLGVTI